MTNDPRAHLDRVELPAGWRDLLVRYRGTASRAELGLGGAVGRSRDLVWIVARSRKSGVVGYAWVRMLISWCLDGSRTQARARKGRSRERKPATVRSTRRRSISAGGTQILPSFRVRQTLMMIILESEVGSYRLYRFGGGTVRRSRRSRDVSQPRINPHAAA
jgi:hypothetical protein